MSRKPNVVKFPLVALTLIAFTAADVASGDDAKPPGQGEPAASLLPSL